MGLSKSEFLLLFKLIVSLFTLLLDKGFQFFALVNPVRKRPNFCSILFYLVLNNGQLTLDTIELDCVICFWI